VDNKTTNADDDFDDVDKLSSADLAGLFVDALHRAGIVKDTDVERAIAIVTEEIDVRKSFNDL
jgi:hypothetical protein